MTKQFQGKILLWNLRPDIHFPRQILEIAQNHSEKKEQRSFNTRRNLICYSYLTSSVISQVISSLEFDITFPFFDRLAFVLSAAAAQSLDSCCQLTLT